MSQNEQWSANYFSGAVINGKKIQHVYSKGTDYVIYKIEGDGNVQYSWRFTTSTTFAQEKELGLGQFESLKANLYRRFKDERVDEINPATVTALRQIFKLGSPDDIDRIINELKHTVEKIPGIKRIVGRGRNFAVWINDDDSISIRYGKSLESPDVVYAVAEFARIKALAAAILPAKYLVSFNHRLAAAIAAAFQLSPAPDVEKLFSPLDKLINETIQNEVRLRLLLITTVVAVGLMSITTIIYHFTNSGAFWRISLLCATGGVAGSLISFLERSKSINIKIDDLPLFAILSSLSRVALGGLFGIIAYSAAEAELAFSLFKGSKPALLILGVVAGFSERLIPEMIGSIAQSKNDEISLDRGSKDQEKNEIASDAT